MSGFTALNVEPEDTVEEEVDDTKEIQLEEAFKLYQNALKLHSQGPDFYDEAADAYTELFNSEVFKYPEVVSEYAHDQLDEDNSAVPVIAETEAGPLLPSNAAESSANSIPQLVYLSHKNKGQFALDKARYLLEQDSSSHQDLSAYYARACKDTLKDFAEALERDDSDLDLWKKAARVADVLANYRISRFCLESVLAGDDDGTNQSIDLSGLDEAFAAGELEKVIDILQDDLSKARSGGMRPKDALLVLLRRSNDPYQYLPKRPDHLDHSPKQPQFSFRQATHKTFRSDTMAGFGQEILQSTVNLQDGAGEATATTIFSIQLPEMHHSPTDIDMAIHNQLESEMKQNGIEQAATDTHDENTARINSEDVSAKDEAITDGTTSVEPEVGQGEAGEETKPDPNSEAVGDIVPKQTKQTNPVNLPTRKRSSTAAGNDEPEGRAKSKRLRARESIAELAAQDEEAVQEVPKYRLDQLAACEAADYDAIEIVNMFLSRLDLPTYGSLEEMRSDFWPTENSTTMETNPSAESAKTTMSRDLYHILAFWTDENSQALTNGHGSQDFTEKSAGLTLFLQHSRPATSKEMETSTVDNQNDLLSFAETVNTAPANLYDVTYFWLLNVLTSRNTSNGKVTSSYLRDAWNAAFKETVVKLIVYAEEQLHSRLTQYLSELRNPTRRNVAELLKSNPEKTYLVVELVQTVFELYLDIYSEITNPSSQVDQSTRDRQAECLLRWAGLADDYMQIHTQAVGTAHYPDELVIRFIWSSTIFAAKAEEVDKSHVILCLQELRQLLEKLNMEPLDLPNNAAMPQISVAAVDQEVSRLSTLDFFMSVFDSDNSDSIAVIEQLEPILEPQQQHEVDSADSQTSDVVPSSKTEKLIEFLESGDASLKLFLWRRLQNAYTAISYTPKIVSCLFRSIETIFGELCSHRHLQSEEHIRQLSMLKWLKDIDELVIKVLTKVLNEQAAFEFIDRSHLLSSLKIISAILRLLQGAAMFDDALQAGQIPSPQLKGASSVKQFEKSKDRLREMQVRLWTLQYTLLREATIQYSDRFPHGKTDLANYLSLVHYALGQRHYCKYSNKTFVKLVKSEIFALGLSQEYAADVAQVFFDLYQLKFAYNIGDQDHGCPTETLDKKTALSLIPVIMEYANRLSMKDLLKSELRGTIEKIHNIPLVSKTSPALLYNKKLISTYLKSPVVPSELYNCIKGIGDLPTRKVSSENAFKASHGWYFMLGHMMLARYRLVKRVNPTPTDDLDTASHLLRQDLEYDIEKWESWYRLAQVFEAKIEDDLIWNSTKLNDSRSDIALLERNAIHCYTMAIAAAMRSADDGAETAQKITDMYREFALRLYSSSREPLSMEAFKTDKNMRHLSSATTSAMSKEPFHQPMTEYRIWKFAAYLLRQDFTDKPKPWTTHYILTKCLWKMLQSPENATNRRPITAENVLEACVDAIEALPKKEKANEYILEPHIKLVSIVHKMIRYGILQPDQGARWLNSTRFAQKSILSQDDEGKAEWEPYILDVLKKLANADKSNWHHRIIARAAHVIYDDQQSVTGALGAKHELTQQIFTKTMTLQVWKPEYERPGRHYVYTGRYVLFFTHLLEQLSDRASLDQLIRRIRRKPADFIDHLKIWEEVVTTYVRLLRRAAKVPEGRERLVFDNIPYEEFAKNSERMEKWTLDPDTTSIVLDVIRDAVELKKLNNSLMKGTLIDDVIGDSYACLYESFMTQYPPELPAVSAPVIPLQGTFINMTSDNAPPNNDDGRDRMRMGNFLASSAGENIQSGQATPIGLGLQTPSHQFIGTPPHTNAAEARPVPGKPGRAKTITRREIQRKAEAALVKPPPIKTPILEKRPVVEIPAYKGSDDEADRVVNDRLAMLMDEDGQDSRTSSRRGSIHDSADDESELSELEDSRMERNSGKPPRPKENALADDLSQTGDEGDDEEDEEGHHAENEEEKEHAEGDEDMNDDDVDGDEDGDKNEDVVEEQDEDEDDEDEREYMTPMETDGDIEIPDSQGLKRTGDGQDPAEAESP